MRVRNQNLKWFLLGVIIVILFTVMCEMVKAEDLTTHHAITLYTMSTDKQLTVAWDDSNPDIADYFDFYMWNHGEQKKYAIGKTQLLEVSFYIPRTGLYVFFCRACDKPESDTTRQCSTYSSSVMEQQDGTPYAQVKDPATGQLIPGKWMVYGHVGAPTGGGVDPTP